MLKITRLDANQTVTLKLEGRLLGPWVDLLERACTTPTPNGSMASLDLSGVVFVDAAGASLLAKLVRRGVRIIAQSNFVAELLHTVYA